MYQDEKLPLGAVKIGETPIMNQDNALAAILNKHMSPKGKYGLLVVESGQCDYLWEDTNEKFTCDKDHPIVIEPERYHHVIITGDVEFKVEFYRIDSSKIDITDENAIRPGEDFIEK